MKIFSIFILSLAYSSCFTAENVYKEKNLKFNSGNFSGMDYIMITKKAHGKREYVIRLDCNHYINGLGKIIYITKEVYNSSGKYSHTNPFIKDSLMLSKMSYAPNPQIHNNNFTPLSSEEYEIFKTAFIKYTKFTNKYNLNADSLRDYLGWFELSN